MKFLDNTILSFRWHSSFVFLRNTPSSFSDTEPENLEKKKASLDTNDTTPIKKPPSIPKKERKEDVFREEEVEKQISFIPYERMMNPDVSLETCGPVFERTPLPEGYKLELSDDPKSFQYFLEHYPIADGDLEYDDQTIKYLTKKIPTEEAMEKTMKSVRSDLKEVFLSGDWENARVSEKYFDNKFSNLELYGMWMGWKKGKDIRQVNYFKSFFTDGKLNLNILNHQDCIDSCLRFRIEYLLQQKDYEALSDMGISIEPDFSDEQIEKEISRYFQTTHTSLFAAENHQIGHEMTDEEIENSDRELEVGDFITFNKKGRLGGHTVLVMAKARNEFGGECVYRIATGTLPATEMALYDDWIPKDDLLGGNYFTNYVAKVIDPGVEDAASVLFGKGIKIASDYTVSIGSLSLSERDGQAKRSLENKKNTKPKKTKDKILDFFSR